MSELKFTHCVEFEALAMDIENKFQHVQLHMLCLNEDEANVFADMLKRDKIQYTAVSVTEFDEPIVEMMNEND